MRCRIKTTLNNLKVACPNSSLKVKNFLRAFDKEFDYELRARNRVHHHQSFEDIEINRISITGIFLEVKMFTANFGVRNTYPRTGDFRDNGAFEPGVERVRCRCLLRLLRLEY